MVELVFFIAFIIVITGFLLLDLGVLEKDNHIVSFKSALTYTFIWVSVSICFYFLLKLHGEWVHLGPDGTLPELKEIIARYNHPVKIDGLDYQSALEVYKKNLALEYITGYVIEWMLSLDNIFVMVVIFFAFKVDSHYYRRVLFYGILAAVVFRFAFIFSASAIIHKFHWVLLHLWSPAYLYGYQDVFVERSSPYKCKRSSCSKVCFKIPPCISTLCQASFLCQEARQTDDHPSVYHSDGD